MVRNQSGCQIVSETEQTGLTTGPALTELQILRDNISCEIAQSAISTAICQILGV